MKIPTKFKGTIYFYWSVEFEFLAVSKGHISDDYILLGQIDNVSIDFDKDRAINESIKALKASIDKVKTNAHKQVSDIEQQIQSLLAIEYNGDDND